MGPVSGIKVVELGVWVAGPAAGGILADWGADVVKIESPQGDPARTFSKMFGIELDVNPPFEMDNRSKRSIVLDLRSDEGRATALELLAEADVFLTNVRPAALQRLGLDYETLSSITPVDLRIADRLRLGRARRRRGRLRRCGVLGPLGHRVTIEPSRRTATISAKRLRRSPGRDELGGRNMRGAVCTRADGGWPAGQHFAVPDGRLHGQLRPEHVPADRSAHRHRTTRNDAESTDEQLLGR